MKTDDPRFTAFVLDELDEPDRSAIEALLRDDPALSAEIAELRHLTASLRRELQAEEGAPLGDEQRAAVLGARPQIVSVRRAWWRRPWVQSAAAACVIVGVSAVMLSQIEMRKVRIGIGDLPAEPAIPAPSAPSAPSAPALPDLLAQTDAPNGEVDADTQNRPTLSPTGPGTKVPQPVAENAPAQKEPAPPATAPASKPDDNARGVEIAAAPAAALSSPVPAPGEVRTELRDPARPEVTALSKQMAPRPAPSRQARGRAANAPSDLYSRLEEAPARRRLAIAPSGPPTEQLSAVEAKMKSRYVDEYEVALQDGTALERRDFRYTRPADRAFPENTEAYDSVADNQFLPVKDHPLSTFSIDVDTASYSNLRRFLNAGQRPPKAAVRIEELVNYFRYDYPQPDGADPFSCALEVAACPWQADHRLVRIGLKGKEVQRDARPAANLVFLVDVSGSMAPENKLPLVRSSLKLLVDQLNAEDSVAIAVYAGASGCVLEPTSDKTKMRDAITRLEAGGSTNGAAGIQLAYDLAQRSVKKNGINRVILCTDGDFNVGITSQSELVSLIQAKAKSGIFLSVLGFGMGNLKDSTLEKLADHGNGHYAYIDTLNEGRRVFVEQMNGTLMTIAKDVKVQVEFNPAQVSAYRLIGYENRLLAKEDFNDDSKDAGEIGAGHTVTALYQVVPVGKAVPPASPGIDDLKYQKGSARVEPPANEPAAIAAPVSPELLTVKLRYKQPDGETSKKIEFPLTDNRKTWEQSSRDFRWAASVAGFGLLLRDSPHKGSANWSLIEELAIEGKSDDRDGYRAEFVGLIEKAKVLAGPVRVLSE